MKSSIENMKKITENRAAGVLMHVSSLPGKYGIGTLGKSAYEFIDVLSERKIGYWQVLPLVQTSFGDSPYQSEYSGSGNPYFIDPEILHEKGLLTEREINHFASSATDKVDYGWLFSEKYKLLRKAFSRFDVTDKNFVKFVKSKKFESYALYSAIKYKNGGASFDCWQKELKFADKKAIADFKENNKDEYLFRLFLQFEFFNEWNALRKYAHKHGVKIIGDIPLYVAYDSADVWSNPELFKLDKNLKPKKVAGVPPDYFSATGQLWGNPVYDWAASKKTGYAWWIDRFRRAFELYDVLRVDHFRGFDRYYEIPAGEATAINGKWVNGPKNALFKAVKNELGDILVIAEDLGTLDEGVYKLLCDTKFPGMKVIEFAFDGNPNNPYLPENINENSVCYTGTHDNDTLVGLVESFDEHARQRLYSVLNSEIAANCGEEATDVIDVQSAARAMIKLALVSKSRLAVVPVQDICYLDGGARMNTPSSASGNWAFRLDKFDLQKFDEYAAQCKIFGRLK